MKSKLAVLAGVLALLLVDLRPASVEACGVKLTVKAPNPRKAAARSSRPSPVDSAKPRPVVKAREERTPIAAGPKRPDRILAAKTPEPKPEPRPEPAPPPAPEPAPPPAPAVTTTAPPVEETPRPRPVAAIAKPARAEVYFGINRARPSNRGALRRAIRWLKSDPDAQAIIEGHADPTGNPEDNMTLSQKRAESVRDILVAAGVDESRLEIQAFGDTRLKYGRRDGRNRRVQVEPKQ